MSTKGKTRKKPIETSLGKAPKDSDRVDLSHLKKPIITSLTNLRKILHLFKTATPEVQEYISYECDILFECKYCRSIFRSLANFILHKREYCREKSHFNHDEGGHVADDVTDLDTPPEKTPKTIEATIDKLRTNQKLNLTSQEETEKSDDDVIFVSENVVLEKIDTSQVAKFQTVGNTGSKLEILEMHDMDENQVAVKPDGKICHFSANLKRPFACFECKVNFSTEKTLVHHVRVKHNKNSTVFLCPDCKEQFSSSMGVYRHLLSVHKRTNVQVRRLRNFVRSGRRDQQQEKQVPKLNSEEENEENQWLNNLEGDKDLQMCGGCGKRFERKAALMSHSQMCIKRIAVCQSIKNVKKPEKKEKVTGAAKRKAVVPTCRNKDVTITKNVETVWLPAIPEMEIYTISDTESLEDVKDEKSLDNKNDLPEISPAVEISLVKVKNVTPPEKDPMECQQVDIDTDICQKDVDVCHKNDTDVCQNNDSIDIPDSPPKESKKSPEAGNFTDECREFLTDSEDWRFLTKIESHVDVNSLTCTQCDRNFPSTYTLVRHMSYHFSWFRYQCSKCSFLSFHRDDSTAHAYSQHNTPNALSDRTVLPIPMWKVLNKGHDFKSLDENEKIIENGDVVDLSEEEGMPTLEEEKCEDAVVSGDEEMPNLCMDSVIVSDDDDDDEHLSKKIKVEPLISGRPVRNRMRSIKTVQDDFIYDFGGALKTNDALAKNKKLKKSP